jgi:broad specificity phosphatase PhoE
MNRIYYVRHGENRANLTKEFSCRKVDYSLTTKGRLQAEQTAELLAEREIHAVFSSPLRRAQETAAIIAARLGLPYTVIEELREINVGDLENGPVNAETWGLHDAILLDWLNGFPETTFPGGEDYHSLWARTRHALAQVVSGRSDQNLVVVGHGGQLTLTLSDLCGWIDRETFLAKPSQNCSITTLKLELRNGRPHGELVDWASHDHLHGEAATLVPGTPDPNSFNREDE